LWASRYSIPRTGREKRCVAIFARRMRIDARLVPH
jgi:hypothetical protein